MRKSENAIRPGTHDEQAVPKGDVPVQKRRWRATGIEEVLRRFEAAGPGQLALDLGRTVQVGRGMPPPIAQQGARREHECPWEGDRMRRGRVVLR
jgi:hypothetical protein